MKTTIQFIIFLFVLPFLFFSCEEEEAISPASYKDISACSQKTDWDPQKIRNALHGEWEWRYIYCLWSPEEANDEEFKELSIEFKTDNTLDIKQEGLVTQTATWEVLSSNGAPNFYTLEVVPKVEQLQGLVIICNKEVVFNSSFLDLCDNYFTRK